MQVIKLNANGQREVITYRNKVWYHEDGTPLTEAEINTSPVLKRPPNQPKPFTAADKEALRQKIYALAKKPS